MQPPSPNAEEIRAEAGPLMEKIERKRSLYVCPECGERKGKRTGGISGDYWVTSRRYEAVDVDFYECGGCGHEWFD